MYGIVWSLPALTLQKWSWGTGVILQLGQVKIEEKMLRWVDRYNRTLPEANKNWSVNNDTGKCKCVIWERLAADHQMRTLKEFSFIPTPQAAVEPHCWNRFNYKLPTLEKRGTKTETQELQNWYLDISLYTYHSEVWFFHPEAKESQSTSVRFKYLVDIWGDSLFSNPRSLAPVQTLVEM